MKTRLLTPCKAWQERTALSARKALPVAGNANRGLLTRADREARAVGTGSAEAVWSALEPSALPPGQMIIYSTRPLQIQIKKKKNLK